MNRYVIADIHGRHDALVEVLDKSGFNREKDLLICLGDVVDGGTQTKGCVDELLGITNLVFCLGNHDKFFMDFMDNGWQEEIWLQQGGCNTLRSYGAICKAGTDCFTYRDTRSSLVDVNALNIPVDHQDFFNRALPYYILDDMCFVHGGFDPKFPIEQQQRHTLLWDRDLIRFAQTNMVPGFSKVFVGHTTTQTYGLTQPIKYNNLFLCDCGAGWDGKLAIMDIDTEEHWLSKKQERLR